MRGIALSTTAAAFPGFHIFIARFVDDRAMIAVLANNPDTAVEKIVRKIAQHIFGIPPVTREPITLSETTLDKAVGIYLAEDGFHVEITREGDRLKLLRPVEYDLQPINESAYYASQDDEYEVHFTDERNGAFNTLTLRIPLYREFQATRV